MEIESVTYKSSFVRVIIIVSVIAFISTPVMLAQSEQVTSSPSTMETVIMSTDRSIYLPGDELLLMVWIAEADSYQPSGLSSIVRVEITGSDGNTIVREKLDVSRGIAEHILKIPGTVSTGWYQIRAYTNWMRNFPSSFYSSRNIRIVNPSDLDGINLADKPGSVLIRLIPEGQGQLTGGIENRCAVRVTDLSGNPVSFTGALVNSMNDTLTTITSGKTGWGVLAFVPEKRESYRFVSLTQGISVEVTDIPEVSDDRPILTLTRSDSGVDVRLISKGRSESDQYRLIVHSLYTWYWFRQLDFKNGVAAVSVPAEYIPSGSILQFSVLDNRNMPVAARLWFDGEVSGTGGYISTREKAVQPRTSATLKFEVDDWRSPGIYSLVVRKKEPVELNELYIPGLPGWPCTGEIPASAEEREAWLMANLYEPSLPDRFYENSYTPEPAERIINYMDPAHIRESLVEFLPETRGTVVSGKIIRGSKDADVQGETLTLTTFSDNFVYTAISQPSGRFHFVLPHSKREHDAVISFIRKPSPGTGIEMCPEYDSALPPSLPHEISLSAEELDYIRDMSINRQLTDIFSQTPVHDSSAVPQQVLQVQGRQFGYPDYTVYIDYYIRLPNMREVIAEVVPTVIARRSGDNWELRIINENFGRERLMPLILLDGLPLTNFNEFLALPPERIRKIDVFNNVYIHGNATFGGIVNFVSINTDLAGMTLPEESKLISISMPRHTPFGNLFSIPADMNIPALPTVLLNRTFGSEGWGSLNVPVSDNLGEFIISISGFTSRGRWVNLSALFVVERRTIMKVPERPID